MTRISFIFETHCLVCKNFIRGRTDKKFCNLRCKNKYHQIMRLKNRQQTWRIDQFLHRNRTIMIELFRKTDDLKIFVPKTLLYKMGFKFDYYSGSYINNKGKTLYLIYDFAWMTFSSQDVLLRRNNY